MKAQTKYCNSMVFDVFVDETNEFRHYSSRRGLFTYKDFILSEFPNQTEVLFVSSKDTLRDDKLLKILNTLYKEIT